MKEMEASKIPTQPENMKPMGTNYICDNLEIKVKKNEGLKPGKTINTILNG